MDAFARYVPHWLAWPLSALAAAAALAGAALLFFSVVLGAYVPAIWGLVAFIASGALWYAGDMASSNRPIEH